MIVGNDEVAEAGLPSDDDGELVLAGATVKTWPAKLVVLPVPVAIVMAGPPREVTSTTGTSFVAAERISMRQRDGTQRTNYGGKYMGSRSSKETRDLREEY